MRWTGQSTSSTSKKQRLNNLLISLRVGPAIFDGSEDLKDNYTLWLESWIIPEIQELFPNVKIKKRGVEERDPE
ncbi:MAG: hypothetical protein M0Q91_16350 [Methanoregula sp.]|jgi:hypothetical protein|nr:hypothetical protein [Methanoregula sp.]